MSIKLIATDLDKTLLHDDGTISERTRKVFLEAKEKGVLSVIATGRSVVESSYALNRIEADKYMIIYSGACVMDLKNSKPVYEEFINEESALKILSVLENYRGRAFSLVYTSGKTLVIPGSFERFSDDVDHKEFFDAARAQLICEEDPVKYIKEHHIGVNKIFFMGVPMKDIENINNSLKTLNDIESMLTRPLGMDYVKRGANKGAALISLTEYLGLKREEVMVLGDSGNDLSMFTDGFFKVAVRNAMPEILSRADYITASNNDDGVAAAIEKLVL